jgi:hypothetical protein
MRREGAEREHVYRAFHMLLDLCVLFQCYFLVFAWQASAESFDANRVCTSTVHNVVYQLLQKQKLMMSRSKGVKPSKIGQPCYVWSII